MRTYTLPIYENNRYYFFDPITGSLLYKNNKPVKQHSPIIKSTKLNKVLQLCNQPYSLQNFTINNTKIFTHFWLTFYAKLLVRVCKTSFLFGKVISKFGRPVFPSSYEAICYFRKMFPGIIQNDLCYPRSLFAASLSRKFKTSGVLFIGVFLPSKSMHAWIIEDETQPDIWDNSWINYQPVAVIA